MTGSAAQWDQFNTDRVLPVVQRLLGQAGPTGEDVPPLRVIRDQWGVIVLSRTGIVDTTWVESLARVLGAAAWCRPYAVQFTAREIRPVRSSVDVREPSMGRVDRAEDAADTAQVRAALQHMLGRFGVKREEVRLEVALRNRR